MKFIFSLILIIFLSSAHINAADTNILKFDEKINEFKKKNNLIKKIRPNKFEKEKKFDITKKEKMNFHMMKKIMKMKCNKKPTKISFLNYIQKI